MSLTICIFVLILTSLPHVSSDICRPLATMIETQTFYLTQPYSKNISLDLSNFEEAFADLTEKAKLFNSNLNLFDEETELTDPKISLNLMKTTMFSKLTNSSRVMLHLKHVPNEMDQSSPSPTITDH